MLGRVYLAGYPMLCSSPAFFVGVCLFNGWRESVVHLTPIRPVKVSTQIGCNYARVERKFRGKMNGKMGDQKSLSAWFSISGRRGLSLDFSAGGLCFCSDFSDCWHCDPGVGIGGSSVWDRFWNSGSFFNFGIQVALELVEEKGRCCETR